MAASPAGNLFLSRRIRYGAVFPYHRTLMQTMSGYPDNTASAPKKSGIAKSSLIYCTRKVKRMDMLKQLNAAMVYIEQNLCNDVHFDEAARIACVTRDSLMRFFSYMTGMTLHEYVRRRRLTLAACDLKQSTARVMDLSIKYGYESADAFSRAFAKQHGITPTAFRRFGGSLKVYPPVSFHIMIKGAREMDFRMLELPDTEVCGVAKPFDGQGYQTREELRHTMWADDAGDVPGQICEGRWNQPGNHAYDGIWYGIWQDGSYMIAREKADTKNGALEKRTIPAGTYAAFRTGCGGLAWEEFPKLFELIWDSWLPTSGYRQTQDMMIEVLHLWTDHDKRRKNRYYEVWLPVTEA